MSFSELKRRHYRAGPAFEEEVDSTELLRSPPISILMDQQVVASSKSSSDGGLKKASCIEQSIFAMACSATETCLQLYPFEVDVSLDSPTTFPVRKKTTLMRFKTSDAGGIVQTDANGNASDRPTKRAKSDTNGQYHRREPLDEVQVLSRLLLRLLEPEQEGA